MPEYGGEQNTIHVFANGYGSFSGDEEAEETETGRLAGALYVDYLAPTIASVNGAASALVGTRGGDVLTLLGDNFGKDATVATVTLGALECAQAAEGRTHTSLRCTVPAGQGQCPRNPGVFRVFSTLEARISVNLGPIRLLLGPLIISARVLEI